MKSCLLFFAGLSCLSVFAAAPGNAPAWSGQWSFDGTLADAIGRGGSAYTKNAVFVDGVQGKALKMSADASATVPDSPNLRLSRGFRLSCRFRLDHFPDQNAWAALAMKGGYDNGEYILRVDPSCENRHLSFFINTGDWEPRVSSRVPVQLGVWYNVEAGWDEKGTWLAVNGDMARTSRSGTAVVTHEPLHLGTFDGALDELKISSPGGRYTGVAEWPFDGDLRDASGHGHDFTAKAFTFEPMGGRQALRTLSGSCSTPSTPDLQIAPGLRLDCSLLFRSIPEGITYILLKEGEYMLRLDPKGEGNSLSFFVNLDGRWEPRVKWEGRVQTNTWYHVAAAWNGFDLTLDVNGEQTKEKRSGIVTPGKSPLIVGRFDGLLYNLVIENPKPAIVRMKQPELDTYLFRVGQSARLSGTVRNCGSPVSGCVATLIIPDGIVCETPASLDLGPLPANGERSVEWRLRAVAPTSAMARIKLSPVGSKPSYVFRPMAVMPKIDPDLSSHAWNPPVSTNAATYYVDAISGDNARAGTSPETAWRDFTNINGRKLGPGERLLVRRGSVINQELGFDARGTAQAWVEIATYGEGARPIIRRNRDIDERCALFTNPDYLCIRGLTVCYAGKGLIVSYTEPGHRGLLLEDCIAHHIEGLYRLNAHGIPEWRDRNGARGDGGVAGGFGCGGSLGEDIVFRDCEMFQCSSGFRFTGKNVFIDRVFNHDNYAHNTSPHPFLTSVNRAYLQNSIFDASGWHAHAGTMGIMLGGQYGLLIRNCHFINQPDSGSHDEGGIDFEAGGAECLVDHCTFRNNAGAAIEMLGLRSPQTPNVVISRSRFDRNNVANKLGPSEIFIWGGSRDPTICCSSGIICDNGFTLAPNVLFFTNQAPVLTHWTLTNNTQYSSSEALDKAMPYDNPPTVDAGFEIWTDSASVQLAGKVSDDGRPANSRLVTTWELLDGPGTVSFQNAADPATKAGFSSPGDYTLRLKADDGELWRSDCTVVHVLPQGTVLAKAWAFSVPLDKDGWSDWNLGTTNEEFRSGKSFMSCISKPVHLVAGGEYITAIKDAVDAHLLSADALGVNLDETPLFAIRFQNHTPAVQMRLRFTTEKTQSWEAGLGKTFDVVPNDNASRLYVMELSGTKGWNGKLKQLRLDFSDGAALTGTCRIDYMWLGRRK